MLKQRFCRLHNLKNLPISMFYFTSGNREKVVFTNSDRPETYTLDGKRFVTDQTWNISPTVRKLVKRHLLSEQFNPLTLLKQRIVDYMHEAYRKPGKIDIIFDRDRTPMFTVCENEGRIVSTFDNFDSLLVPLDHVSRKTTNTYYVNNSHCLRAHTSAHQYRLLQEGLDAFLIIGDVYRRDEIDSSHFPCFHQVEGVRLFSSHQLLNFMPGDNIPIFENGERTATKQEKHTDDAANALKIQLQCTLEELTSAIFGNDCVKRWVDTYFPFTHPSFELEIFHNGKWLEVLGCGIMEQRLLENAGVKNKVGWAFGLGLERIAMVLYDIPDIRLFWTKDSGFLSQFNGKSPMDYVKYKPISVHPQVIFDMSFYLPKGVVFDDMTANVFDTVRNVGGDLIEQVILTDEFINKRNQMSQTYRIVYRSHTRALTKAEVNVIHKQIACQLIQCYGVSLR
ncbi:phenylalanine--tRNA ligase [Dictyocaulus viviparus]|uniref:Phenylalanine--tRNA ligase, mitochondrial n=1 Tax=Dictyocaulus viviparus TaxID=29172 RepID=A0A0D8XU82_DICVI|nr:phenylalanine--tRNA ligase [Dictyocaulus viviparus]